MGSVALCLVASSREDVCPVDTRPMHPSSALRGLWQQPHSLGLSISSESPVDAHAFLCRRVCCPRSLGFRISWQGFKGPYIDGTKEDHLEALARVSQVKSGVNLYCVNELYFKLQPDVERQAQADTFKSTKDLLYAAGTHPTEEAMAAIAALAAP
jgi:hypothetical protein